MVRLPLFIRAWDVYVYHKLAPARHISRITDPTMQLEVQLSSPSREHRALLGLLAYHVKEVVRSACLYRGYFRILCGRRAESL